MNKLILTILFIFFGLNFSSSVLSIGSTCEVPNCPEGCGEPIGRNSIINMLSTERSKIPNSLLDKAFYHQIPKFKNGNDIQCGVNAMCASFSEPQSSDVMGWIGFEFEDKGESLFIATLGEEAYQLDDTTFALPIWDKKHFWISVDENSSPMAIQPRYAATDIMTGHEFYVVDYIGYKKPGIDYSGYQFEMSLSALVIEVDVNKGLIVDIYIEYYTDDEYLGAVNIENGDQLVTLFLGLDKKSPDTVTFLSIDNLITVTQEPDLFYEEWYPGITFPCANCNGLDFSQVAFKYIFESFVDFPRSTFTEPLSVIDEIIFRNSFE